MKDLKVFAPENEALFKEMTQLLTLDDIRYDFYNIYFFISDSDCSIIK